MHLESLDGNLWGNLPVRLLRRKGVELMEFCRWGVDGPSCSSQVLSVHAEEPGFKVAGLKAEDDALV